MIDNKSIKKLIIITFILDLFLFGTIYYNKNKLFDCIWISSVIVCHILFYYSLINYNIYILNILHYLIFILPSLSLFTNNIFINIISFLVIILIQFLWIYEKKCILNENDKQFGFGNELHYYVILLSSLLALNIGYNLNYFIL